MKHFGLILDSSTTTRILHMKIRGRVLVNSVKLCLALCVLIRFNVIRMMLYCSKAGLRCLIVIGAMDHLKYLTLSKVCAMAGNIAFFGKAEAFVTLFLGSIF